MVLRGGEDYSAYAEYSGYRQSTSKSNKYVDGEVEYHRVKKGETLASIARRYGISVKKICNLNNITSRTRVSAGKSLRVS